MSTWTTTRIGPKPFIAVDHQGTGPVVVFLHGIGGNRTNWHDQLAHFAPHFTAVAWDGRGYGASDDYDGPLDFADFSADLVRVLDHFGAEKAHLVGLSMGGMIVQDFHGRHARRVASLVLVDTNSGVRRSMSPREVEEFLRLRREPLLAGKQPKDIAPTVAPTLASPKAPPAIVKRLIDSLSALRKESYLKTLEATTRYDGYPALATIKVPCLVVVGADDRLTPPETARALARDIPGARLAVIDGAGHLTNIEKPAEFNREVLAFLLEHRDLATFRPGR
ncbi:MAG: alpha/beta fold hydrolase [Pseudomonadota bacterium]